MVHPTGIEPVSTVPETAILSVELRVQVAGLNSLSQHLARAQYVARNRGSANGFPPHRDGSNGGQEVGELFSRFSFVADRLRDLCPDQVAKTFAQPMNGHLHRTLVHAQSIRDRRLR